MKVVAAIQG